MKSDKEIKRAERAGGNNKEFLKWVENEYYRTDYNGTTGYEDEDEAREFDESWCHNGKVDIYHEDRDGDKFSQSPQTVAQHFRDRTELPYR